MRIGITFGVYDLLHLGHLVMLEEAKRHCDYLIVGLKTNALDTQAGEAGAAQTVVERYIKLEGCQYVDEIIPYESDQDMMDILQSLDIGVRFIGEEYRDQDFTGKNYCLKAGIDIIYTKRKHRFSSQDLRRIVSQKEFEKAQKGQFYGAGASSSLSVHGARMK